MKHALSYGLLIVLTFFALNALARDYGTLEIPKGWIQEVHDGDTVYITDPTVPPLYGARIGLRVSGIDTPEMASRCTDPIAKAHEETLARQAKALLEQKLAAATRIQLQHIDDDKYGRRYVGDLVLDDVNVAPGMIASGLAVSYHGEKKVGWCGN